MQEELGSFTFFFPCRFESTLEIPSLSHPRTNTFFLAFAAVVRDYLNMGLSHFHPILVDHAFPAYALALAWPAGPSLVVSGDTRPCENLVQCVNSLDIQPDLVVHEATFEDELQPKAIADRHSTLSEALSTCAK